MGLSIVCVDIAGEPSEMSRENSRRIELLMGIKDQIRDWSKKVDVVLLPGGYFYCGEHVGPLSDRERFAVINSKKFSKACKSFSRATGALVVAGVDGAPDKRRGLPKGYKKGADQMCVAWNAKGVLGLGRKVFPARPQKNKSVQKAEGAYLMVYAQDYSTESRLVCHKRRNLLLCACYDVYGCSVGASNGDDTPLQHVKWLTDDGEILGPRWKREIGFVDRLRRSATSWRGLVDRANVVLGSIHKIELSGSVAYWQRHGFTKRAKNNPGKAFLGAAHYSDMPFVKEKKSRFAVKSQRRKVDLLLPKKYFRNAKYCMRLFEV